MVAGATTFVTTFFLKIFKNPQGAVPRFSFKSWADDLASCPTTGCATTFCRIVAPTLLPPNYVANRRGTTCGKARTPARQAPSHQPPKPARLETIMLSAIRWAIVIGEREPVESGLGINAEIVIRRHAAFGSGSPAARRSRKVDSEMGSLRAAEIGDESREHGAQKHRESFYVNSNKGHFRAVIDCLVPPPARAANLVALFDGRATYSAIQNWRSGRNAPAWAIDLACQKLNKRLAVMYRSIELAPRHIEKTHRRGAAGARALAAWRERKAREKEKAAELAALEREPD